MADAPVAPAEAASPATWMVGDEDALVQRDLLSQLAAQTRFGVPMTILGAGLYAVALWPLAGRGVLAAWLAAMVVLQAAFALTTHRLGRRPETGRLGSTAAVLFAAGVAWGAGPLLIRPGALATARASLVLVFTASVAASSVIALASSRRLFVTFISPLFAMTSLGYLMRGAGDLRLVLSAGSLLLAVTFVTYNHQAAATLANAVRYRHRAALLAARREDDVVRDSLTGLLNRAGLFARAEEAARQARHHGRAYAFVFVDVDHFKRVNDEIGHRGGDEVLRTVARRLQAAGRSDDTPARLGGDEFVVLMENVASLEQAHSAALHIGQVVRSPFEVEGVARSVSVSVGVAFSADGTDEPTELLNAADRAMYRAKGDGRATVIVHDEGLRRELEEQSQLDRALRVALDNREFIPYAQPIVELATGRVTGAELLVRWQRPQVGVVEASSFIGAAERAGLIVDISRRMLEVAGELATGWAGDPDLGAVTLAVNVGARHLRNRVLVDDVRSLLACHPALRRRLVSELTETETAENMEQAAGALSELRAAGVVLAIDDFGKGYSSLAYLKQLPVHLVKIDRQFVAAMTDDDGARAIVVAAAGLARAFGLQSVAEGVETPDQASAAQLVGCRYGQGYWFARPLPIGMFESLVRAKVTAGLVGT